ncbi:MAG: ParB/RepB/Spo0J family partition protein [Patescibacteria group bacterium]|jgi:ParB family chromosome partitioning protein
MSNSTLGRGLGSLIPHRKIAEEINSTIMPVLDDQIREIEVRLLKPNPHQPRVDFDRANLEDLINSIKVHGIISPLIVIKGQGEYQIIAGERRWRAAKILGLKKVPVVARSATEQEKLELALVENVQRQNLNPIEKAYGYQRLIDEFNLTQEEVGKKVGQSRAAVSNALRLLTLEPEIQKALIEGIITEGHAKVLLGIKNEIERLKVFKNIISHKLSVRSAEDKARTVTVRKHIRQSSKDPNITALEESIREKLGTKVEIQKNGEQGLVKIHFYSTEELREIINKITG